MSWMKMSSKVGSHEWMVCRLGVTLRLFNSEKGRMFSRPEQYVTFTILFVLYFWISSAGLPSSTILPLFRSTILSHKMVASK